ncbi:MAG: serine/threonine protein kinase [Verrucomicrobiaceae bacterium]|nr:serine/threonine protein kinase [Verrucomicrobiaceae bacterium]
MLAKKSPEALDAHLRGRARTGQVLLLRGRSLSPQAPAAVSEPVRPPPRAEVPAIVTKQAVEAPVEMLKPEVEIVKPAPGGSSTTRPGQKPSTKSFLLRKKGESAIEGGRDAVLERVAEPHCYNCRVTFDIDVELEPLSRIVCPRCQTKQVVPARIEHFVLERELGRGGMGVTYRAFDEHLQRNVAVKLISEKRAGNRESVESLVREARRAATLSHPNIVPVYSIGSAEGRPYVVMELLSDAQLLRPVARGKALEEVFVLETGLAVARALAEASAHGILHLDVKPANILHDRFGVAKLIDFGLACHMTDENSKGWGTCLYMAPERLRHRGQDGRSDQYSLGLTMWQALAGRVPFEAPDQEQLAKRIVNEHPPLLNHLRPDLLEWTAGLIHKMLAHDPAARYQDYDQLIRAFGMVLEALKQPSAPVPVS